MNRANYQQDSRDSEMIKLGLRYIVSHSMYGMESISFEGKDEKVPSYMVSDLFSLLKEMDPRNAIEVSSKRHDITFIRGAAIKSGKVGLIERVDGIKFSSDHRPTKSEKMDLINRAIRQEVVYTKNQERNMPETKGFANIPVSLIEERYVDKKSEGNEIIVKARLVEPLGFPLMKMDKTDRMELYGQFEKKLDKKGLMYVPHNSDKPYEDLLVFEIDGRKVVRATDHPVFRRK